MRLYKNCWPGWLELSPGMLLGCEQLGVVAGGCSDMNSDCVLQVSDNALHKACPPTSTDWYSLLEASVPYCYRFGCGDPVADGNPYAPYDWLVVI